RTPGSVNNDMNIMLAACMIRNTVKNIRAELEEINNANKDVVIRKKGKRRSDSLKTPDFISKLQRRRSTRTPASMNPVG
ncbi:Hypothetical protein FKW44_005997, partial [Caligus rogercresseyi]